MEGDRKVEEERKKERQTDGKKEGKGIEGKENE
jgi:hypothetical protein